MNRRRFLQALGIGVGVAAVPAVSFTSPRTCYFVGSRDFSVFRVGNPHRSLKLGNWHDPCCWLWGRIPREDDDVLISGALECELSQGAECWDIVIEKGAVFRTNSKDFDCHNFTIASKATVYFGRSLLTLGEKFKGRAPVRVINF